jgi:hypothetical protein
MEEGKLFNYHHQGLWDKFMKKEQYHYWISCQIGVKLLPLRTKTTISFLKLEPAWPHLNPRNNEWKYLFPQTYLLEYEQ